MDRMIGSTPRSKRTSILTNKLVQAEIAYLDSATDYRECLPIFADRFERQSRLTARHIKPGGWVAWMIVFAISMFILGWGLNLK